MCRRRAKVGATARSRRRWTPASTISAAPGVDWSKKGIAAALTRKYNPNSARPRIFDGAAEAKLIALTCSPAPVGFARWSLRLLEEKVVELNIIEKASDNTIGRTLKKRPQAPPQSAMGDPAGRQRRLRRRHGRRAGNLPEAARSRSPPRLSG